jgi:hypothetical protein
MKVNKEFDNNEKLNKLNKLDNNQGGWPKL